MSKKNELVSNPATTHTLDESRAITSDILELSESKLKKELSRRVEVAQKNKKDAYSALGDHMFNYNEALKKIWEAPVATLQAESQKGWDLLNGLAKEGDTKYTVEVKVNEQEMLFGLEEQKEKGYYYQGEGYLKKLVKQVNKEKGVGDDVPVAISIQVNSDDSHGSTERDDTRILDIPADDAVKGVRQALVDAAGPYYDSIDALSEAEADLGNLGSNMHDLKMRTVEARVENAGGKGLMDGIDALTNSILEGNDISDVSLALPAADEEEATDVESESSDGPSDDDVKV